MTDQELDRLIWESMIECGWIIPTTPEAVEIAERAMQDDPPFLPDCLRTPPKIEGGLDHDGFTFRIKMQTLARRGQVDARALSGSMLIVKPRTPPERCATAGFRSNPRPIEAAGLQSLQYFRRRP